MIEMSKFSISDFEEQFVENMALEIFGTDINPHTDEYETKYSSLLYDMINLEVYNDYYACLGILSWAGKNTWGEKSNLEEKAERVLEDWAYNSKTEIDNQIMDRVDQLEEEKYNIDVDTELDEYDSEYEFDRFVDDFEDYLNY